MTKLEKAKEVIKILNVERRFKETIDSVSSEVQASVRQQGASLKDGEAEFALDCINRAVDLTSWELSQILVDIYMEAYTEEELEEMLKWYTSPLGKSIAEKNITLVPKMNRLTNIWKSKVMQTATALYNKQAKAAPTKVGLA